MGEQPGSAAPACTAPACYQLPGDGGFWLAGEAVDTGEVHQRTVLWDLLSLDACMALK